MITVSSPLPLVSWTANLACLLLALSCAVAGQQSRNSANSTGRYELKFQNELDNSTIIKLELQQQIFKCQVRLAPISQQSAAAIASANHRSRSFKSNSVKSTAFFNISANDISSEQELSNQATKWPANVSLTIDWLHNEQQLVEQEPTTQVINVELLKNSTGSSRNDKKNKPRIEIKNTLNSSQLKLTSRLKVSQLKLSDSGQYKCIARASFQTLAMVEATPAPGTRSLAHVEQVLESNGPILMVITNQTSYGK